MQQKVQRFIDEQHLFDFSSPIVVATSGGVDSVTLLYLLHQLGYQVILAHVNHHQRMESAEEERQMRLFADELHIPFELCSYYHTDLTNFHNDAHYARYRFFRQVAEKYHTPWIATAHHLDDQMETILMRLMQGSNLYGYGGLSVLQENDSLKIARPFLCLTKKEIYDYAFENHLIYFEDSSNQKDDYLRNRIRHHLLPVLKGFSFNIEKVQEFSVQVKEAFSFIRSHSIKYLDENQNIIDVCSFFQEPIAVRKDILCLLFEKNEIPKNQKILLSCYELLKTPYGNQKIDLKNSFSFVREYDKAMIRKEKNELFSEVELQLDQQILFQNRYRFYFSKKIPQNNANYLKLCYNNLKLPFFVRNRKDGDCIKMSYGNKKVSRLMIDRKLSALLRQQTPIVTDATGTILWVVPFAKSQEVAKQKSQGELFFVCEEVKNA